SARPAFKRSSAPYLNESVTKKILKLQRSFGLSALTADIQEIADPCPTDLDAEAEQDEGREPDGDVGPGAAEDLLHTVGKRKAGIDGDRHAQGGKEAREEKAELMLRIGVGRSRKTDAHQHGNRAWTGRQRQRERIERLAGVKALVIDKAIAGALVISFIQQFPARGGNDKATRDPQDRNRNS